MLVKICGIQTIEAAKVAALAGADYIGFVFAESSRKVSLNQARKIAKHIPKHVQKVGVFVNEELEKIKEIKQFVPLDVIQLHGDESPLIIDQLNCKTIKAFSIDRVKKEELEKYNSDFYLIDSPPSIYRGGSGKTFDWSLLIEKKLNTKKLFLAGGLHPDNIQEAIITVNPLGVDVSSGVETNGEKDLKKIKQFIKRAKGCCH